MYHVFQKNPELKFCNSLSMWQTVWLPKAKVIQAIRQDISEGYKIFPYKDHSYFIKSLNKSWFSLIYPFLNIQGKQ